MNFIQCLAPSISYGMRKKFGEWSDFETNVRKLVDDRIAWNNRVLAVCIEKDIEGDKALLHNEQYLCGDEQSTCGRFAHNVLHVLTAVAWANNMQIRFGDYKVCQESKRVGNWSDAVISKVPDFVAVDCSKPRDPNTKFSKNHPDGNHMRFIGEAKTSWCHDLPEHLENYRRSPLDLEPQRQLRRALGMV